MLHIPTLRTERLSLVPLDHRCEPAYQAFYTDAKASANYGGPLSAGAAWARLAADLGTWYLQGFGVWAVRQKVDQQIVGVCGFWQGKGWPRELTWWLLPQARGQGLAKEASLAVISHAYEVLGWPVVETYMNDSNASARALVLSLDGEFQERRSFPDGLERDIFRLPNPDRVCRERRAGLSNQL
ncbi:GNAT family N-acetyltransferase [Paucibacter sp. B2R-40]|uniref:GNAT family N-acetyltransferase n=1 Tax=Paucibacter sp. B2R-40 TaxID=2893554 RepID=UPI0021E39033|nr:GNAT family N-acetyltransferase [Paucibacter sp. B2R-40]MCV2352536.1 GNAT family N-acetyltransferase [Paucibacter sp. B2R-40]